MFVRIKRVKTGGKVYEYPELARSYRRESDGMSVTERVCKLDDWSDLQIENLKRALEAAREGEQVLMPPETAGQLDEATVTDNLTYLGVAVLYRLWEQSGLGELVDGLVDQQAAEVDFADMVASLVLQRCVAPGSKFLATRWFPRTALVELMSIDPEQFNNTRIHRVLDRLDELDEPLQRQLADRLHTQEGNFRALFVDVTDTWFEGGGGELATKGKTKEGMTRKKVGIVLICNDKGYPLRWKVVSGRVADTPAMVGLLEETAEAGWLDQLPVVVDRAMGATDSIRKLEELGLRFVTALRRNEIASYTDLFPVDPLLEVDCQREDAVEHVAGLIEQVDGFECIEPTLYLKDLGVIQKTAPQDQRASSTEMPAPDPDNRAASYLEEAETINEGLREGRWGSQREAARDLGTSKSWVTGRSGLRRIADDIHDDIKQGGAPRLSVRRLIELSRLSEKKQREVYQNYKKNRSSEPSGRRKDTRNQPAPSEERREADEDANPQVRGVVYFNPEQFVDQRRKADETLGAIYKKLHGLNTGLREGTSRISTARDTIRSTLKHHSLLDAFELEEHRLEGGVAQLFLELDEAAWRRRRQYDGFSLCLAHPDLKLSAEQICREYRAKNTVEVDFRTIKSFAQLRPVYHQTDAKIRAHVTICMLSLLVERMLSEELDAINTSASMALETLKPCHLNRMELPGSAGEPAYTVTRPTPDQEAILRHLEMTDLVDDSAIRRAITAR